MKRLKSSDDLNSYGGEKGVFKDWGRKDDDSNLHQSSSHRSFHYKSESGKRGLSSSSSSRYERVDDDRKNPKLIRKRSDYDVDSYERRKSYDRYRDSSERGILSSSPRGSGYGGDRIHRSESFSGPRRDFPKGFRSERDRSRREGSVSSWRRFGGGKDVEEGAKSGSDSARGSKAASEEVGYVRSPQGGRDAKSPAWSKDSGSEQSKSVEVKKSEESLVEESGNNSEREEGELEPEPEHEHEHAPVVDKVTEDPPSEPLNNEKRVEEIKPDNVEEKVVLSQNVISKVNESESPTSEDSSNQRTGENDVAVPFLSDSQKKDPEQSHEEEGKDVSGSLKLEETKPKEVNNANLEVKGENMLMDMDTDTVTRKQSQVTENEEQHVTSHSFVTKELTHSFRDKGKSVLVSDTSGNENGSSGIFLNSREIDIEGPSTRGFDLFFTDPVKKTESSDSKLKDEKLTLEPLELSLRLPSVLLPIGSQQPIQGPDSPSQEMSMQSFASSFQTNSDGFSLSRSFSGSHNHNPSCSLTETSFDFEKSVGSRPLFGGVSWQVPPPDEPQPPPPQQQQQQQQQQQPSFLSNGNGIFQSSQSLQLHGNSKLPIGLERQLSSNNHKTQSGGSHETGSDHHKDRKRLMREAIGSLSQTSKGVDRDHHMVDPILAMVVSDPIHIVSRILTEMTNPSLTSLKESTRDIITNPTKRRQFSTFRRSLEKRSDITLDSLSKAHITHLQILTTLKTGIQDFLTTATSPSDLAEIFLNIRCRNLMCKSYIPVDECDCKVCVQKKGFCSSCMCLVCSKFDMASNTCSWVGCDVCLHWCHTDCGIREGFIRNGRSVNRVPGHSQSQSQSQTEMQFHCVACDHPSEMFGFVREVFQNFAVGWSGETLLNEIEYVRRIFSASEDIRGKRLHEISLQMMSRLSDKSNVHQVRSFIMAFLNDDDALKTDTTQIPQEVAKPSYIERPIHLNPLPVIPREPVFDELDGIVRIKLAEAEMFQMRADDARREAEGLNRIAQAKSKKIDEEFASRVNKLHLTEAEEIRRQKLEELQSLENAHQEYFNMKVRMEREIKDLLMKMEATKRNFSS